MAFIGRTNVHDPGEQQDQWERLARRREQLYIDDEQFRNTKPDEQVAAAARAPGLRIAEVMATVLQGYSSRPALGQRAREIMTDPASGRSTQRFLPRFETASYADLWARIQATAADWHHHEQHPVRSGDFVCAGIRQHRLHRDRMRVHTPRCGGGAPTDQRTGHATRTDPHRDPAANFRGRNRQSRDRRRRP